MKILSIPILGVLSFFLISCNHTSPSYTYSNSGLSFTCPQGWMVSDEEEFEGGTYYLSVEKQGFDSSGILTITMLDNYIDLVELSTIMEDELKANIIYEYSNLSVGEPYWDYFAGNEAYTVPFTSNILGVKHTGYLFSFYSENKTYSIFRQEADEDSFKNAEGFMIMEDTFKST